MSRELAKAVLVGGVIYSAGEDVPDDVAKRITADVWADGTTTAPEPGPDPHPEPAGGYAGWSKTQLQDEIRKRNDGRDADEAIAVTGNVAELVERLEADDRS